jgi:outer membrane lipoprotein LolB
LRFSGNAFLLLLAMTLLSACASRAPQPETRDSEQLHEQRMARLLGWQGWSLTGRLGVNRGDEGGSGRLDWTVREDTSRLAFRGTLGQGAWRLDVTPDLARLELKDGTVREAPSVEGLVLDQTGWNAPVTALGWWVRGLVWPDGPAPTDRQLNEDGTLAILEQAGWRIDWTRYTENDESLLLPSRLQLTRADVSIKLAISRWASNPEAEAVGSAVGASGND